MVEPQSTSRVLLIRPAAFGPNPETAATNAYQSPRAGRPVEEIRDRARAELESLAEALDAAGVEVAVRDDTPEPVTPDAVFPNNWVSFHADGSVVLYPLLAPSRRREVRPDLIEQLEEELGLHWPRRVDLTPLCERGAFLEGTGSLVLDRAHRVAYACLSPRTTAAGLEAFARELPYEIVHFHAEDAGVPVYHTNVVMSVGPKFAVVCLECVCEASERARLRQRLEESGHEVIALSRRQMRSFAGNLLALQSSSGEPRIALSQAAWSSLEPRQTRALERHGQIVRASLPTLEAYGGGSVRCTLAELHAPPPAPPLRP